MAVQASIHRFPVLQSYRNACPCWCLFPHFSSINDLVHLFSCPKSSSASPCATENLGARISVRMCVSVCVCARAHVSRTPNQVMLYIFFPERFTERTFLAVSAASRLDIFVVTYLCPCMCWLTCPCLSFMKCMKHDLCSNPHKTVLLNVIL